MGTSVLNQTSERSWPTPSAILELLKPITWFPPMWAFSCGVIASGQSLFNQWHLLVAGVFLAGPMVCATSQAINDWFDRHVDAIQQSVQKPDREFILVQSDKEPGSEKLFYCVQ